MVHYRSGSAASVIDSEQLSRQSTRCRCSTAQYCTCHPPCPALRSVQCLAVFICSNTHRSRGEVGGVPTLSLPWPCPPLDLGSLPLWCSRCVSSWWLVLSCSHSAVSCEVTGCSCHLRGACRPGGGCLPLPATPAPLSYPLDDWTRGLLVVYLPRSRWPAPLLTLHSRWPARRLPRSRSLPPIDLGVIMSTVGESGCSL